MLKMMSFKVGFVLVVTVFLLLLIYFIPNDNKYSLSLLKKQQLEYINFNHQGETIFLLDVNNYVAKANIIVSKQDKTIETKAKALLEALTIGSKNEAILPSGFKPIIPTDTKILEIKYDNSLIEIDFSKKILEINKDYEEKMIEAIIYTLTNIGGVNKVLLKVEGKPLTILPKTNTILLNNLDKTFGINKVYEIGSTNDIVSVTIYYLNKHQEESYYIPVTKYLNEKKDKIKIIIDELASGPIYESNLMSFLNAKTKLLNYSEEDNKIVLDFNDYILSDMKEKNILEEVSYCIAFSIFDNYDVSSVDFKVEGEIIETVYKSVEK